MNNTWGPHYAGKDVAHGVQMRAEGPHQNRLVMARRYDCKQSPKAPQTPANPTWDRSFVLYSDDGGKTVRGDSARSKRHLTRHAATSDARGCHRSGRRAICCPRGGRSVRWRS